MKSANIRLVILASVIMLTVGCTSMGNRVLQHETNSSISSKIREGVTSKEDVYAMLGKPFNMTFTDSGLEVVRYEYTHLTPRIQNFIPYNIFSTVKDGKKKELVILFDSKNIVRKFVINESEIQVRRGILE